MVSLPAVALWLIATRRTRQCLRPGDRARRGGRGPGGGTPWDPGRRPRGGQTPRRRAGRRPPQRSRVRRPDQRTAAGTIPLPSQSRPRSRRGRVSLTRDRRETPSTRRRSPHCRGHARSQPLVAAQRALPRLPPRRLTWRIARPGADRECGAARPARGVVAVRSRGCRPSRHRIGSWRGVSRSARLADVTHPSLGLPPPNETAGFPDAATRLRAATTRLGARALEIAVERDPSIRDRYDEIGLRHLLRDTEIFIDRIALAVASNDPAPVRSFIDQIVPIYRRRRVPMDDLGQLFEGLR